MIIGITGTLGAGKGTVVESLKEKGFNHHSMSGFIREEIVRRGIQVDRDAYTVVGDDIRAEHGPGYIAASLAERAIAAGGDAIIESIQTPGEAAEIRQHGGVLWAVDADPHIRYERIRLRGSEKDNVTFEDFMRVEKKEMSSDDPTKHNIGAVVQMADYTIHNDGSIEELRAQVDEILGKIRTS